MEGTRVCKGHEHGGDTGMDGTLGI